MKPLHKKIKVVILFGGKSIEHEVSLQSAKNVYEAIDKDKYDAELVKIDKGGRWEKSIVNLASINTMGDVNIVFPVLHGPLGEDGSVQGLLKLAGVPFVGASVLGSAVGMDKDVQKRLLRDAGINIVNFVVLTNKNNAAFKEIKKMFGSPFFIKPASLGSSVGVRKVFDERQFKEAVAAGFSYDKKILIEEYVPGREIECSVLGNDNPTASLPGEVIPKHEFYSYEAKYVDENGASLEIPAKLAQDTVKKVQDLAVKAFRVLCCEGMARVDFFLRNDGKLLLNEINTIPGFTKISMYPKLWEASGVPYSELIDRLIKLAVERHKMEQELKTSI